jgi:hypothetical protein
MKEPILITGMPRSGSSMIAAAISHCGAYAGECNKMYENVPLRDKVVKHYFDRNGFDSKGQYPIPLTHQVTTPENWKTMVEGVIGYREEQWMYKDGRSCLIWPVWHNTYPDAKWVIVRRRTGDVIQSCLKTGYMTAYNDADGWLHWVHQYERKFVEMIEAGLNCKVIWPERMVDGDYKQLYDLCEWLGLTFDEGALEYIKPLIWGTERRKNGKQGNL